VTYRVRSGDTLGEIAQQFGVSTRELRAWNGLSSSRIVVGQTLTVHPDGSAAFHVVQRGDTLGAIAESYGTTIRRLREMNDLSGSRIYPGQKLKISAN
jgi:membrane-bound lytic murein transglycosylase D